jgi:hypothetical protein
MNTDHDMEMEAEETVESRTELDTHANMPVVGKHAFIIGETGETVNVNAFSPDYPALKAKIVDAAVRYDCPYDGKAYLLIIRNAVHVPSMNNNLIPPFVMREIGIHVNDIPKIHVDDPTVDDHAITFPETGFRIPLNLWGVFSYFPTTKPTVEDHDSIDDVYVLTPPKWNPHTDLYSRNEENMIDWEGNIVQEKDRVRLLIADIDENAEFAAVLSIGSVETLRIDSCLFEQVEPDSE